MGLNFVLRRVCSMSDRFTLKISFSFSMGLNLYLYLLEVVSHKLWATTDLSEVTTLYDCLFGSYRDAKVRQMDTNVHKFG